MSTAADLLPNCKECGHGATFHLDRVVAACAVDSAPLISKDGNIRWRMDYGRCFCTGYRNWGEYRDDWGDNDAYD